MGAQQLGERMRIIFCLLLCLLPLECLGFGVFLGGEGVGAGSSKTYTFNIEFDNDTDWTDGYTIGGNDYSAGDQSGTITGNQTRDTTFYQSSPASWNNNSGSPNYMSFSISNNDLIDMELGYLSFIVRVPLTGTAYCIEVASGDNDFFVRVQDDGKIKVDWRGGDGSVSQSFMSTSAVTASTWTRIDIRWDVSSNARGIRVGSNEWENSATTLVAFENESTVLMVGGLISSAGAGPFNIDNLSVWKTFDGPGD